MRMRKAIVFQDAGGKILPVNYRLFPFSLLQKYSKKMLFPIRRNQYGFGDIFYFIFIEKS
ncbi:hypothetical protein Runsl_4611 [Runella slithyformis DSM 19594]|uniref:Uncharacterized protein n=1 Tax=Runella slithyformis (strain ATCC 29530 / DSM 19594 / LMG 11500 / NCIMB 11436 / LSU 4) TaxID=761193 RepID=A0A7U3ZPE2_RUNSL|nr:hypothetical protein Runsl_4611 [Runella slithyformis DSM 19594]